MYEKLFQGSHQVYSDFIDDKDFIRNDSKLNRTFVDMGSLGLLGYGTGLLLSVFFRNRAFIRNFGLGFGLGYGFHHNMKELLH